jgi:hypothetical protein
MSESHDEIIATAMLLGAEFVEGATFLLRGKHISQWSTVGSSRVYTNKLDAALGHLRRVHGVDLNFDGVLTNMTSRSDP